MPFLKLTNRRSNGVRRNLSNGNIPSHSTAAPSPSQAAPRNSNDWTDAFDQSARNPTLRPPVTPPPEMRAMTSSISTNTRHSDASQDGPNNFSASTLPADVPVFHDGPAKPQEFVGPFQDDETIPPKETVVVDCSLLKEEEDDLSSDDLSDTHNAPSDHRTLLRSRRAPSAHLESPSTDRTSVLRASANFPQISPPRVETASVSAQVLQRRRDGNSMIQKSKTARSFREFSSSRRQSSIMQLPHAVQSVDRNSNEWKTQLYPFVSDIVFRSINTKNHHLRQATQSTQSSASEAISYHTHHPNRSYISFRPYTCQAAILFVDLCGYSRITAAIAHRGAHVLSETVNAYLSRLLSIIAEYGGDVIKFAGDAIMIIWEGDEQELEINVLCAALCATELQTKAGEHKVDTGCATDQLSFQIHCGLCCGPLDSEIFEAPIHTNMQRLYHYVGGEAILEIGELVDLAKAGEICVSRNCFNFLENGGAYTTIPGPLGAKLLHSLDLDDPDLFDLIHWHIEKSVEQRRSRRIVDIEEDFIHGNVLAYLSHGGFSPTQIAQMRNLCVLFIAMTSNGSSVNWLMEVQAVLDTKRCPIVQIILDDKGVHIVAAVNLYEAIPEASLVGLEVCRELVNKRVGAAVGCAIGPTFCGVTGSTTACRWDITGPSVVRAARLMQYALANNVHFAIDQSLYDDPMAATRLKVLDHSVPMKGNPEPIAIYTLSDATLFSAFRLLENVHGSVHNEKVQEIQNHIDCRERSAVIVTGIPLAGMTIACQRAAGYSDFVPYLHLCEVSAGFLQLARTIATWFQYVDDQEIKDLAQNVISDMSSGCWSCAHDHCVHLVNVAIEKGCNACFVVDRLHYLDKFSLSLIRECLQRPRKVANTFNAPSRSTVRRGNSCDSVDAFACTDNDDSRGHICFLCTHMSLYNSKSAEDLVGGTFFL
jgi:class 3 adenylate cyclase